MMHSSPRFSPLRLCRLIFALFLPLMTLLLHAPVQSAADCVPRAKFEIKPGDHICIIGNTLADRMQHDGWLETMLHSRFPKHELVIRNLGFSADELTVRLRSANFGSQDQWLAGNQPIPEPNRLTTRKGLTDNRLERTNTRADVIFAFFGYNESFAGAEGLDKFKNDLEAFIKHTLAQKYNGKSAPRLVLFSPIAHEDLHNRNLPDGKENNKRLEMYTKAIDEVATKNHVVFVDLFHATLGMYEASPDKRLTINGIHLNEYGNFAVAKFIDSVLADDLRPTRESEVKKWEKLRQAVLDKNFYWFSRYRTLDGYNVYGGRAFEKYADKQSNYEDQQREMEILDVMTSNRDKRIWAVAQGKDFTVEDSNTPPFIPVKTNKPGNGPNGEHIYLDGETAIQRMTLGKDFKINLFASEKKFPELAKPVQMQFDAKGRLWVAVWPSYPHWKPKEEMSDKILIFEDADGDGKADKTTVFADRLHCPTGFEFYNGGVLVAQAPDLMFLKDTDGDGKADRRVRVLSGLDSADSHHTSNSFALDPGGALYFQEGTFHHTQVETPYGPPRRCVNAGVFRYEPRAQKFDVYVTFPFANPHGHVWDRWGEDFVFDGTGANPYHGALFSGHLNYPFKHARPPQVYQQRTRPCPGVEILSSRHFPKENQGNLLVGNVIGFQGILQYKVHEKDSSFTATEVEPIVYSSDPNFRPSDLKIGPDGAIWFIDWHNTIIGHLQHALRDPSRDRTHGRIYRITRTDRPLLQPVKIADEPIEKLLDLLKEPEDRVRYRVRIELGGRDSDEVIAAVKKWIDYIDKNDPNYQHNLTEALWLHQAHNVVNVALLKRMLSSPDFHARAAATRVLCYWRDRVPDALELLKKLAADASPRVRLQAVRAASFFTVPEAIEIPLIAAEQPMDPYIDFVSGETMKALNPIVSKAIKAGKEIHFTTTAGARFFLKNVCTDDLLHMKRTPAVFVELLFRKGVRDEYRKEALAGLARGQSKSELRVLLDAIRKQDEEASSNPASPQRQQGADESVVFDLIRLLTSRPAAELAEARGELEKMATDANLPVTRQLGFVALIAADGAVEKAWELAVKSAARLRDLIRAMPLIRDPGQKAALYPKVEPLLAGLPKGLTTALGNGKSVLGRYVRIELPGRRRTLTLAEVEVLSDGRNIARRGKASQKNTAYDGDARKAIDGNTNGSYGDSGQTHSVENTANPWWQVDLGGDFPIDSIVVWNRTDDGLGKRLSGFTVKVLDKDRKVVFEKNSLPAPKEKIALDVGGESPEHALRRAAMIALTSVRGKEADAFKAIAKYAGNDADRHAAIQALQRIPSAYRPKDEAKPLLDVLLPYIRAIPVAERTTPAALDALQLADSLASLLPLDRAKQVRRELGELGVRVIRMATVPDQMLFDKERIVVKAGKPVEIIFDNNDLMPHNFVVTRPGSLEEIGMLAETTATQLGALERGYVPQSPKKILLKSKLIQPRNSEKLSWSAPKQPGVYPYVCTYPGHWRRMYGALYVVADLDEYLADPEDYLSKHPLPIADDLLKFVRPRKEWKFEELASSVEQLKDGRSFSNGKQIFQAASCVSCHKFGGAGNEIGPDLTKIDPKQQKPIEILRDLLDPSFRINEKYQTFTFVLESGKVITGLVVAETPDAVKVIENPLVKADPLSIKKADIAERKKSPVSIMPKGLLDKLTHEEILDLIAYVAAAANPHSPLFSGGHEHGQGH
ncbi:MAG TPA: PVC-type heme-binding CxxCH protein [Gemmataceae bacterium]|nr:PVC-type heme-binding CxxCH protein [Gemmataceae bacterium]